MKKYIACFLFLVVFVFGLVAFNFKHVIQVLTDSSEYAPGYSEAAYNSVEIGMTQDELVKRLGKPLRVQEIRPGMVHWYGPPGSYVSEDSGLHVPDGDYSKAAIMEFDRDDGRALNAPFKGKTADQVEAELGKPIKEFKRTSIEYWHYSQSWSSGNYYRRWIGIDQDGRVAEKKAYYYWD